MNWKARLTEARERKQLSKSAFALRVGISAPTATDWEKDVADGGIAKINGENLTKVCEVLGITSQWLYTGNDATGDPLNHAVELLNLFASLPQEGRSRVLDIARHEVSLIDKRTAAGNQTKLGS